MMDFLKDLWDDTKDVIKVTFAFAVIANVILATICLWVIIFNGFIQ